MPVSTHSRHHKRLLHKQSASLYWTEKACFIPSFCSYLDHHAGIANKMLHNRKLWKKRPLSQDLITYAVEDVSQLLTLADKLTAELGTSQLQLLAKLSQNYSQMVWLPADMDKSRGWHDVPDSSSMLFLAIGLSRGTTNSSASWLTPLFWSEKDVAAYKSLEQNVIHSPTHQGDKKEASSHDTGEESDYYCEEDDHDIYYQTPPARKTTTVMMTTTYTTKTPPARKITAAMTTTNTPPARNSTAVMIMETEHIRTHAVDMRKADMLFSSLM